MRMPRESSQAIAQTNILLQHTEQVNQHPTADWCCTCEATWYRRTQILTVWSREHETMILSASETCTMGTLFSWPSYTFRKAPVFKFQTVTATCESTLSIFRAATKDRKG
jgi:hypothetical protein